MNSPRSKAGPPPAGHRAEINGNARRWRFSLAFFSRSRGGAPIAAFTLWPVFVVACLFFLLAPAVLVMAKSVAIFDFASSPGKPTTVARSIELWLKNDMPGLLVSRHAGSRDLSKSRETLQTLDSMDLDLLIVLGDDSALLARHFIKRTATLFASHSNPLSLGMNRLGPSGTNVSGVSCHTPLPTRMELFREFLPGMRKPGFIFDDTAKSRYLEFKQSRLYCLRAGLEFTYRLITKAGDMAEATNGLISEGVDAIVLTTGRAVALNMDRIAGATLRAGIPVFAFRRESVADGAVACLGGDMYGVARDLLRPMALRVLEEDLLPGVFPIGFPNKPSLSVNSTIVRRLGLDPPRSVLMDADIHY